MTVVPRGCAGGGMAAAVVGAVDGAIVGVRACGCPPAPVGLAAGGFTVLVGGIAIAAAVGAGVSCTTCAGGATSVARATTDTLSAGVVAVSLVLPASCGPIMPSATQMSKAGISNSNPRRPRRSAATALTAMISKRGKGRSRRCCAEPLRFMPPFYPCVPSRSGTLMQTRCFDCVKRLAL